MVSPVPAADGVPPSLELGTTYGAMLISVIVAGILYGVTVIQSLYYYEHFRKDTAWLKIMVAATWLLDTVTIILNTHVIYYYLISNFNNPPALKNQVWSAMVEIPITFTAVFIVQLFFIDRIWRFKKNLWYIPAFLMLCAVISYVFIIVILIGALKKEAWADLASSHVNIPITVNWVFGMVADIGITVVLCFYCRNEKKGTRMQGARMLNSLIIFLINRGAIAAFVQVCTLLTRFIWPHTFVWLAFHNVISKVYTNSLLAMLNSRVALRNTSNQSNLDASAPRPSMPAKEIHFDRDGARITTIQFAPTSPKSSASARQEANNLYIRSVHPERSISEVEQGTIYRGSEDVLVIEKDPFKEK